MSEWTLFWLLIFLGLVRISIAKDFFTIPPSSLPNFLKNIKKDKVLEWIDSALTAGILALIFILFIGRLYIIPSSSMEPTLKPGDIVLGINKKWFYKKGQLNLKRGDIVIFKPPIDERLYIKRLIGLPQEKITITNGQLYVNDNYIKEDYIFYKDYYSYGPLKIPENSYFFLGDNRPNSYDSHLWPDPFVDENNIKALALAIIFPPQRIKILYNFKKENAK